MEEDYEFVEKVLIPSENQIYFNGEKQPVPMLKYTFKDISLIIYMFGGNDFGPGPMSQKVYSQWNNTRDQSNEIKEYDSEGGRFRDHTICVETQIFNVKNILKIIFFFLDFISLARV